MNVWGLVSERLLARAHSKRIQNDIETILLSSPSFFFVCVMFVLLRLLLRLHHSARDSHLTDSARA